MHPFNLKILTITGCKSYIRSIREALMNGGLDEYHGMVYADEIQMGQGLYNLHHTVKF